MATELTAGERLVFVIGAPRSGTTLLMRMLAVHPDICARPEPHLLTPLAHLGYFTRVDAAPYDAIQAQQAARALVDALPGGREDYLAALRAYSDRIYAGLRGDTRYFLDKTPAYALVLPFVTALYPDAHYMVITRHPCAIFSSYARSFFDGDWEAAHRHNPVLERYVPAIADFLRDHSASSVTTVRYEMLVADPEPYLRALCGQLSLSYRAEMIRYGDAEVPRGLGDPTGVRSADRPHVDSVDAWVSEVRGRPERMAQLRRMLAQLAPEDLREFGFEPAELWNPLDRDVSPSPAPPARYRLQRKALLRLRKSRRARVAADRVRTICDLVLR